MRRHLAWLGGGLALGAAVYRALRRPGPPPVSVEMDSRAEELRQRIAESRELVEERDEFEAAETTVDQVEDARPNTQLEDRRRLVHERGRAAAEEMRPDEPA